MFSEKPFEHFLTIFFKFKNTTALCTTNSNFFYLAFNEILHNLLLVVLERLGQRLPGLVLGCQLLSPIQGNVEVRAPAK
jgi:hypothetical protein